MVRLTPQKYFWHILVCLWLGISTGIMPQASAAAQAYPVADHGLGSVGSTEGSRVNSSRAIPAITLVSFYVEYDSTTDKVIVVWETASELDTAGYFVWRSNEENGTYESISPFQQAEGGLVSTIYEWEDQSVVKGNIYYYKLEEINTDNVSVLFYGPIRFDYFSPTATATSSTSQTGTPAATATRTLSASPTSIPFRTATLVPTSTQSIFTVTPLPESFVHETQTAEALIQEAVPITVTATLQPLPPLQLLFPAPTVTSTQSELAMLQLTGSEESRVTAPSYEVRANLTSRVWLLGGIVLLLWIMLSTFLVLYLHKAQG